MAIHALLCKKKYGHYEKNISCLIGQMCHSMKRYTFEGNLMATELTMWIDVLYGTVKWPITPFYVKRMAIIGLAYHALSDRGVTV